MKQVFLSLVFVIGISSAAVAQQIAILDSNAIDTQHFAAPPAPGSSVDVTDLEIVQNFDMTRTPDMCQDAEAEAKLSTDFIFGAPRGPLTPIELATVSKLLVKVAADTSYFTETIKKKFSRPRPFMRDVSLNPCVPRSKSTSYPSGHSSVSRAWARVLGSIYPAKTAELLTQSDKVAESRVIGGAHHPSDIQAGKNLGDMIGEAYLKNSEFQKCLADHSTCNSIGEIPKRVPRY